MNGRAVQSLDVGEVTLDQVVESQQGRVAGFQKANESALRSLAASDEQTRSCA